MKKHVVERAIVPHNPSATSIINKEKYSLYAPVVRRGQPGMASFDSNDFDLKGQTVSISSEIKAKYQEDQEARDQHLSDIDDTLSNHETAISDIDDTLSNHETAINDIDNTLSNHEIAMDAMTPKLAYDHVITDTDSLNNLPNLTGRVLIKDITITSEELSGEIQLNTGLRLLEFYNVAVDAGVECTLVGNKSCTIRGLYHFTYFRAISLEKFYSIEKCTLAGDYGGHITNCTHVAGCTAGNISNCTYVEHCRMYGYGDSIIINCEFVCGIDEDDWSSGGVTCQNCEFVSNVRGDGTYINCTYVDPDTCKGFVKTEDVGKVQVLTNDGSFQTATLPDTGNFVQKSAFDDVVTQVGAIVDNHENRIATLEDGGKIYKHTLNISYYSVEYDDITFAAYLILYNRSATPITNISATDLFYATPYRFLEEEQGYSVIPAYRQLLAGDTSVYYEGMDIVNLESHTVSIIPNECTIADTVEEI